MAGGDPVGKERKVAIHGKGGIGKFTVSPNLPATLSGTDLRMRQIGRDRKGSFSNYLRGGAFFLSIIANPTSRTSATGVSSPRYRTAGTIETGTVKSGRGPLWQ